MPRKDGDFGDEPDKIYFELEGHEDQRQARSLDEMKKEALLYKTLMF